METINLTNSTIVNISISEYKGAKYADIRKFLKSDNYTGPTPQGITLHRDHLKQIIAILDTYKNKSNANEEVLIKINVRKGQYINVGIKLFKGHFYLDIRMFYETEKYTGPSKKGISIPIEYITQFIESIKKINNELDQLPERSIFSQIKNNEVNNNPQSLEEGFKNYVKASNVLNKGK